MLALGALVLPISDGHAQNSVLAGGTTLFARTRAGPPASSTRGRDVPSGPQSVVPAPLPPGSGADIPGGSARNGVIAPPGISGNASRVIAK